MTSVSQSVRDRYERARADNRAANRQAQHREVNRSFEVYEKLRAAIRVGEVGRGMQLREQDLGAAFAAGRAAVRGALAHLVEDGLIERGRRRGTTVMDFAGACRSDDGTGFRIAGHLLDGSDIDEKSSWCRRHTLSSAPMAVDPVLTSAFGGCSVLIVTEMSSRSTREQSN